MRRGDACYPTDPDDDVPPVVTVDPPVRTPAVGTVRLTTNEPATIYYTSDGSLATMMSASERDQVVIPNLPDNALVSFFAIDLNGNVSPTQTVAWQIDRNGPGTPTQAKVEVAGTMRTVTWTAPSDKQLDGVLVARVEGVLDWSPERGKNYAAGAQLAPGVTAVAVVAKGAEGTFSETVTDHTVGLVRYALWAFDDLHNYGSPANAYLLETLPAQTGELSVNAGTGVVTVGTQPANLVVAGTATLTGSYLEIELEVTNATSRVLFAPKLVAAAPSVGYLDDAITFDPDGDGPNDPFDYFELGGAIPPGGKVTKHITIGGVADTDAVSLTFDIRNNPVIVAGHWSDTAGSAVDEVTARVITTFAEGARGPHGNARMTGGAVTIDGRIAMGSAHSSFLVSYELGKGKRTVANRLDATKMHVTRIATDATGGTGYALLGTNHKRPAKYEGLMTYLVAFDTATLVETARVELGMSRNRAINVSPDGRRLVVASGLDLGVYVVDLGDYSVRVVPTPWAASDAAFTPDGASLVISRPDTIALVKLDDGSLTKSIAVSNRKSFNGHFGPDGRFYLGRDRDVVAIDLTTEAFETYSGDASVLHPVGSKFYACAEGSSVCQRFDTTGTVDLEVEFSSGVYGHGLCHSPF